MDPLTGFAAIVAVACISGVALWLHDRSNRRRAEGLLLARPQLDSASFGREYFGKEQALLAAQVRDILAKHVPFGLEGLAADDAFVKDLRMDELDSLSTVEFLLEVEFRELVEYLYRQEPRSALAHERAAG